MSIYSISDCHFGSKKTSWSLIKVHQNRSELLHHFPETFKRAKYSLSRQSITNYAYIHKDCLLVIQYLLLTVPGRCQVLCWDGMGWPSGAGGSSFRRLTSVIIPCATESFVIYGTGEIVVCSPPVYHHPPSRQKQWWRVRGKIKTSQLKIQC